MNATAATIDLEDALIARAAKGDQRAFERLYRSHLNRVYGLCMRMTRNPTTAEDCTQQTFIQAWKALPRFQQRSSFSTWLHRIAVNVVMSLRRSRQDEIAVSPPGHEETDVSFDTPVEVEDIETAINGLPDGARDVLVLSGIYGYSHAETASMLGVAEGTCKAQLHRARHLLRDRLGVETVLA